MRTRAENDAVRGPARSWRVALLSAPLALYLPQLVPLATSDLLDHGHCLDIYLRHFVVLIGFAPALAARSAVDLGAGAEELVFYAVAVLATLAALTVTAVGLRRWRIAGPVLALLVAGTSGVLSLATVAILRA